ncbi:hypothetical protein Pmani_038748 [Petrolisthes manimaculis]|uniref:Uncharacterized protein n=1 Tax=Petrolisthes manimaculis TaxID=1843537 RepID=A0AAE1NDR6_9EUCA|nr:hypothetical protein Pmani_038748 [Petrolisthes manimaculis]
MERDGEGGGGREWAGEEKGGGIRGEKRKRRKNVGRNKRRKKCREEKVERRVGEERLESSYPGRDNRCFRALVQEARPVTSLDNFVRNVEQRGA